MELSHDEGFEREARFKMVFAQARTACCVLKAAPVRKIIAHFAPDFVAGLFDIRPCERKLRYIGNYCLETHLFMASL